jgi:glycosyltransferase involved in cell wall biosynthesis
VTSGRPALLYVIDNLEFGGGERGFAQLAAALRARWDVRVAGAPGGELGRRLGALGVPMHAVDVRSRLGVRRTGQLVKLVRRERVDLIHAMGARADVSARLAGWLTGVPVVSTIAMFPERYDVGVLRRAAYGAAGRITERLCTALIAESAAIARVLVERHGMPPGRVTCIYRGVELETYRPAARQAEAIRGELGLALDAPVVGTVGRLVYQKAQHVLLEAAARVARTCGDLQVLIVGDGPRRATLDRLRADLKLARCRLVGFRADVPAMLAAMDVFALPSVLEGFPQVLLEALAMARPVVASRIDGITELVEDGITGCLVPPGDADALASALRRLLADTGTAGRLAAAGRRLVEERFSVERMVEQVEALYRGIVAVPG